LIGGVRRWTENGFIHGEDPARFRANSEIDAQA